MKSKLRPIPNFSIAAVAAAAAATMPASATSAADTSASESTTASGSGSFVSGFALPSSASALAASALFGPSAAASIQATGTAGQSLMDVSMDGTEPVSRMEEDEELAAFFKTVEGDAKQALAAVATGMLTLSSCAYVVFSIICA